MKNHYQTLEVFPGSSPEEIKKAFRRLAIRYHPDKNPDDESSEKKFVEIQQAYEVLIDIEKRSEYDKRHGFNVWKNDRITNPSLILQQAEKLHRYVRTIDQNFIDRDALQFHLNKILSHYNIDLLTLHARQLKKPLMLECIQVSRLLSHSYMPPLYEKLSTLAGDDTTLNIMLRDYVKQRNRQHLYERLFPVAVIFITLLLVLMIYLIS